MKNLTDFRKTLETGVDPRLINNSTCTALFSFTFLSAVTARLRRKSD